MALLVTEWRRQKGDLGKGKCLLISNFQSYRAREKVYANDGGETPIRTYILWLDGSSGLPFIPLLPGTPVYNSPETDWFFHGPQTGSFSDIAPDLPHSELQLLTMGNATRVEKSKTAQ